MSRNGDAAVGTGLKCRIWKDQEFWWPEWEDELIQSKKNIGLALSGGGMRACSASVGWLCALHKLKVLAQIKYISSISGGSWTSAPLTFSTSPIDDFLGGFIEPEDCTKEKIEHWNNTADSHASALKNANFIHSAISEFFDNLPKTVSGKHQVDWWSEACGDTFLTSHGIKCSANSSLPRMHGKDREMQSALHNQLLQMEFDDFKYYCTRPMDTIPYPIINGSILVGGNRAAIPVEFTPLYYGTPVSNCEAGGKSITSVLVEPHAFSSIVSHDFLVEAKSGKFSTVPKPKNLLTLHEAIGISSANLAETKGDNMSDFQYNLANFPEMEYFGNGKQKFVDGCSTDNTGILALLRRDVRSVIACLSSNCSLSESDAVLLDPNASTMGTLAGLFGRAECPQPVDMVNQEWYNKQRKVFPPEAWDDLLAALRSKLAAGLPLAHKMTLRVLPNELVRVNGGYSIDIVFFLWGECKGWVDRLPGEVLEQMSQDNHMSHLGQQLADITSELGVVEGNLFQFPFIPLNRLKYSPLLFGLMAQLAAFQLLEHAEDIRALLG